MVGLLTGGLRVSGEQEFEGLDHVKPRGVGLQYVVASDRFRAIKTALNAVFIGFNIRFSICVGRDEDFEPRLLRVPNEAALPGCATPEMRISSYAGLQNLLLLPAHRGKWRWKLVQAPLLTFCSLLFRESRSVLDRVG